MGDSIESLERIRALWEGDAIQDITLLWRCIRRETSDPNEIVELIAEAGERDGGVEIDPETLSAMREIAAAANEGMLTRSADGE